MKEMKGKVAVVTGAASGIGRALAERAAQEGMKVVLADVEEGPLAAAEQALKKAGATAVAVKIDVSKADDVKALAQRTLDAFGAVHLLCNNAGVISPKVAVWETTPADWQWVMGVNLWGVIHGVQTFVPLMLAQQTEGHIVNTASMAGLISRPGRSIYQVTKHGVVTLSETLHQDLVSKGAKVRVSVLCPGMVNTSIWGAERNRPDVLRNDQAVEEARQRVRDSRPSPFGEKIDLPQVADRVFTAIGNESFYILTHPERKGSIQTRMEDILQERVPEVVSASG